MGRGGVRETMAANNDNVDEAVIEYVTVIEDPMLYYQPILALGDYNSSNVLLRLMSVTSPTEDDWQRAFDESGLSDLRYFSPKDPTRRLPWEHIGYVGHEKMKKRAAALVKPQSVVKRLVNA